MIAPRPTWLVCAAMAALVLAAAPARAEDAPADTALRRYLGGMADSTTQYFGIAAETPDSARIDSAEANPMPPPPPRPLVEHSVLPAFSFNRVDGAVPGVSVALVGPRRFGKLGGKLAYANGPNVWLGGAEYVNVFHRRGESGFTTVRVLGGRATARMNRENPDRALNAWRAFINGNDYTHYLRHDGWQASLEHEASVWRAGLGFRDMLESPLATTATWNLLHQRPVVEFNLPATFGRAREVELSAGVRAPFTLAPVYGEVIYQTAGSALGSDLTYRRIRLAAGSDITLGHVASLVPQVAYGRARGEDIPQAAFYIGGGSTLRSLHRDTRGGSAMAIGRLDLLGANDVLAQLHIPHPAALPLQLGVFAAAGTVWGADPYGGPTRRGGDWPDRRDWLGEAGVSAIYNTGLFGTSAARFSYAWPIGPDDRKAQFVISFTRPLDLLRSWTEP